ncbi:carbohydrate ABC transporter permease [Phaeacidiphilus oryzae]|uniref:carbohydrate ABC transporter permease n=1 Tax=Phaeacidiphilus oryzae TaxID=348818 RepID=UPI00056926AD|nr:sugar ABC transporter permease [Phaeacidiphilus oryzae]
MSYLGGSRKVGYYFVLPFFVGFLVWYLYPILQSLYLSASQWNGVGSPRFVGLGNYTRLLHDPFFYGAIRNTFVIWLISIVPQLFLSLGLALVLNEKFVRGKQFFRAVFFFPNIVTPVSIGVLVSLLFNWQTGTINRVLVSLGIVQHPINWLGHPLLAQILVGGVMCWQWFGYNMLLYMAGLQSVPHELIDAAQVDGASAWQIALRVKLPMIRPVLVFTVITSVIGGMQIFAVPFSLGVGSGPDNSLQTLVTYLYKQAFTNNQYGYGAAIAVATFVIIAVLSAVSFRLTRDREATAA